MYHEDRNAAHNILEIYLFYVEVWITPQVKGN